MQGGAATAVQAALVVRGAAAVEGADDAANDDGDEVGAVDSKGR